MNKNISAVVVILVIIGGALLLFNRGPSRSEKIFPDRSDNPKVEGNYAEYGDKDCADFSSQTEAQAFFEAQGGPDKDPHRLDRDKDGVVCESLK